MRCGRTRSTAVASSASTSPRISSASRSTVPRFPVFFPVDHPLPLDPPFVFSMSTWRDTLYEKEVQAVDELLKTELLRTLRAPSIDL